MKILFAECCGALVVPGSGGEVSWCRCKAACCWWEDPPSGKFACHSHFGINGVSVIGIHNSLLSEMFPNGFGAIQKNTIKQIIEDTPETYLFKTVESLIVRFRPEFTNDTKFYHQLPKGKGVSEQII
jgi:hypothetical protein